MNITPTNKKILIKRSKKKLSSIVIVEKETDLFVIEKIGEDCNSFFKIGMIVYLKDCGVKADNDLFIVEESSVWGYES